MNILTETATRWGERYRFRYYLNGRRIPDAQAHQFQVGTSCSIERFAGGWRTKWELPQ